MNNFDLLQTIATIAIALIGAIGIAVLIGWLAKGQRGNDNVRANRNEVSKYRIRLRVKTSKALTSDETMLSFTFHGREVTIRGEEKEKPLRESAWLVFGATSFDIEDDARDFGEELRAAVAVAAFCSRLGVDVGEDSASTWVNEEWARETGLIEAYERLMPNVHGLQIMPDDDLTRIPISNPVLTVTSDPTHLISALEELSQQLPISFPLAAPGIRLLNLALMTEQPLARMILAFAAVEALGQDEKWTNSQSELLESLAVQAEQLDGSEVKEVAEALRRGMHRIGLRQGVLRVLRRLDLYDLRHEWDRLYGLRSGVVHGTKLLTETELHQLGNDSITLCGNIILGLLSKEGVSPPSVRSKHYG